MSESFGRDGGGGRGGVRHPPAKQAVRPLTLRPLFPPLRILIGREAAGRYPAHPTCASGGALATGWEPSVRGPPWMAVRRGGFLYLGVLNVCRGGWGQPFFVVRGCPVPTSCWEPPPLNVTTKKFSRSCQRYPGGGYLPTLPLRSREAEPGTGTHRLSPLEPGLGAWHGRGRAERAGPLRPLLGGSLRPKLSVLLWHRVAFINAAFGPWSGMSKAGVTSVAQTQAEPLRL